MIGVELTNVGFMYYLYRSNAKYIIRHAIKRRLTKPPQAVLNALLPSLSE